MYLGAPTLPEPTTTLLLKIVQNTIQNTRIMLAHNAHEIKFKALYFYVSLVFLKLMFHVGGGNRHLFNVIIPHI